MSKGVAAETTTPTPRETFLLVGHGGAEATVLDSWTAGRMHHAWLIGGPPGVGKATLAYRIARFVLASGGEADAAVGLFGPPPKPTSLAIAADHPVARRIAAAGHADLLTVERPWDDKRKRFKKDLPVEEVRRIAPFLRMTAAEGGWRVVIVDGADRMNLAGQNAILKILEEPPRNCLILLVVDNVGAMLPTIRSRTRRLLLDPLTEAQVEELLADLAPELEPADRSALARLAEGSIGRALELHRAGGLDLFRAMLGLLEGLPRLDILETYKFIDASGAPGDEGAWSALTELMLWWLARLARAGARDDGSLPPPVVPAEAPLLARLLQHARGSGSLDRWVEVWENTGRLFGRAEGANLDRKQMLMQAFQAIEAAAA